MMYCKTTNQRICLALKLTPPPAYNSFNYSDNSPIITSSSFRSGPERHSLRKHLEKGWGILGGDHRQEFLKRSHSDVD